VFGIPAAVAGTMFLVTRIWDTLFDPIVGIMCDRTQTKWGKFRPYIFWMAIPFGIMGILTFTVPGLNLTGRIIYAYITYSLMMMIYSLINVPYASLLGVISSNPKTRMELSSYRMIFAFIGSILVLILVEPLVDFFNGSGINVDLAKGWSLAAVVFAVIAIIFFMGCFFWTKERVKPIKEGKNNFKEDVKDLWRNRPWWILLGAGIAALIFNSIRDGAAVYYFKYYIQGNRAFYFGFIDTSFSLTTMFLVLGQAANILGIIFVTPISNRIGKKKTYLASMALATVFSIVFYTLGKEDIVWVMVLQVLISICAGSIFPLLWSMYADIADYSEWKTGRRATGLIFSSSSMSQKFGWALGGALAGWLLGFYGFKANVEQTEIAQHGIRLMVSFLPAIGTILSVIFISMYPLSETKLAKITGELEKKRKD
jgi:GPH family glycoside/pentoside/hexuronide:cation symporter